LKYRKISTQLPAVCRKVGVVGRALIEDAGGAAWQRHANRRGRGAAHSQAAYFRKPVDDQALLDAIQWALSKRSSKSP